MHLNILQRAQDYTELIKRFSALELTTVGNYKILSEIGSGAFGQVYLGYHKLIRCKVCLKKGNRNISLTNTQNGAASANNDNLMREFYYLREFRQHPHITKLYEIIFTESSVYMILEYYPSGDLFEYVTKNGHLSVDESLRLFTQVVGAVYYLHKSGCCHRDLKLENVLLDKHMNVKLSDFGFTRELPFAQHGTKSLLTEYCGTGAYMAPEIVQRKPYSGIKTDIWALGVMFYTMLTGEMPFDDSLDSKSLEYAIIHNKPRCLENLEMLGEESSERLEQIKMLLNNVLSKDPENRVSSLEDILKLPLVSPYGGEKQISIVNKLHFDGSGVKDSWSDLSTSEKALFKRLVNAGIDREILEKSIRKETLDSVYGLWALLKDEKEKKEKKLKRSKKTSRSMLKLTSSRSFIGSARQAFSASPTQSVENLNANLDGVCPTSAKSSNIMSRNGSSNTGGAISTDGSIIRSGSLKKVRDLVMGAEKPEPLKKLNSIHEKAERHSNLPQSPTTNDQARAMSMSKQKSFTHSRKKKNGHHFSIFNIFKNSHSNEEKSNEKKVSDSDSLLHRILTNSTINTVATSAKKSAKEADQPPKDRVISFSKEVDTTPRLDYPDTTEENLLVTPDKSKLRRAQPTRPVSVISAYSTHTSVSETSNGSGYITGYSTDTNAIGGMNTLNPNSNHQGTSNDQSQFIYSPQASGRPKFSRGISEWSVNISSQAESPNSSFTALSRTNSIDSLSRSVSSRKKGKNKNMAFLRRGRSPLNSKMNAKWALNSVNVMKKMPALKQDKNQIIEEESSEQEDDEDNEHDYDHNSKLNTFSQRNGVGEAKLGSPSLRPSRSYMRKGSIKFPVLPVTEEDDDSIDAEDEADLEEDNNDYDDIATDNSGRDFNKNMQLQSNSNFGSAVFQDNSANDGMGRPSSVVSDSSIFLNSVSKVASPSGSVGSESVCGSLSRSLSANISASASTNGKKDKVLIEKSKYDNNVPKITVDAVAPEGPHQVYSPTPKTPSSSQKRTVSQLEASVKF